MSSSARSLSPPSPTHAFLTLQNLQTPPPVRSFPWAYVVAQSPHENNMSGANTRSVLARFCDNSWKRGKDLIKAFYRRRKTCVGEGEERERALDDVYRVWVTERSCCENRIETTLQKSLKFSGCPKSIAKQIRPSCRKTFQPHFVLVVS